jgi:hypothetical protein
VTSAAIEAIAKVGMLLEAKSVSRSSVRKPTS